MAFRVRNVGNNWEATCKTRTEIKHGKAVRREETLALPDVRNITQALAFLDRKKIWKGLNVTNLQMQFLLKNQRTIYEFCFENARLEMALDDVAIFVCGRRVKMKEIELELKQGTIKSFEKFASDFAWF